MSRELRYKFHSQTIGTWIEGATKTLSKEEKIDFYKASLSKILSQAEISMSEITLNAIMDRVLYNSSEQYSLLRSIQLKGIVFDFDGIKNHLGTFTDSQINEAFHYLITELFFIIGNLTAEQLTPILLEQLVTETHNPSKKQEKKVNE